MISAFRIAGGIYHETSRTGVLRDGVGESCRVETMWAPGFRKYGDVVTFPVEQLTVVLPKLIDAGWEVSGAEGTYAAPGDLELTVTSEIDWFDINGAVDFGTERVKLSRLLSALRK